jgi:SpoVK/Ycf46/Vps4 family AAA+-type ATPase
MPNSAARRQFLQRMIDKDFKVEEGAPSMIELTTEDMELLVERTRGYSGSDLKNLSTEAALMPLREIKDVQNCQLDSIRPLKLKDFEEALINVRKSVNEKDLGRFYEWND